MGQIPRSTERILVFVKSQPEKMLTFLSVLIVVDHSGVKNLGLSRAVASLHYGPTNQPVSRGWQGHIQRRGEVGLSSEHEDDQVDVSSPCQVNAGC